MALLGLRLGWFPRKRGWWQCLHVGGRTRHNVLITQQHLLRLRRQCADLLGGDHRACRTDDSLNLDRGRKPVVGWFWHLQLAYLFGVNTDNGSVPIAIPEGLGTVQREQLVSVIAVVDQIAILRQPQ